MVCSNKEFSVDYDAIIVGGGPAGLAAGIHLSQAGNRVLLLEKESFGGQMMNLEWVEDAPGSEAPVAGAMFASRMVDEAGKCGVQMELGEVVEIESYTECKSVRCADGRGYTSAVVIVAGGLNPRKLGVPGEDHFLHKGVIHCALCDAGLYAGQAVAVCGGGYAGLTEALYLAKHASKVYLIEAQPRLSAPLPLQERAFANPRLDIRCAAKVLEITGDKFVTGVRIQDAASGQNELLAVSGVLARVGFDPATDYLQAVLSLDDLGAVMANERMETDVAGIVVAGDIRSGSPRKVAAALSDGKTAAICAQRLLRTAQNRA